MRTRDLVPIALLGGVAVFIVVQGRQMGRERRARRAAQQGAVPTAVAVPQGRASADSATRAGESADTVSIASQVAPSGAPDIQIRPSAETAPARDDAAIRTRVDESASITYFQQMLNEQDQWIMHWPERRVEGLQVWIDRHPSVADFSDRYLLVTEQVFDEWRQAGFPVLFTIVPDSSHSDIQIRWTDALAGGEGRRIGVTKKARDQNGWLVGADISIALHGADGHVLPPELIAGIARHEVGHALGLGHSPNPADVMYPESRTTVISDRDRATLHLLYALPPGRLK